MSEELQYRVFSLSSEDHFPEGDLQFAMNWLRNKGDRQYYFQKLKPRNLPIGSFILFSFESQVFGRARTGTLVSRFSEAEQRQVEAETGFHYTGIVRFVRESIEVFEEQPLKKHISDRLGIIFNRNFTKLTRAQYEAIVRMAGATP
ncbi:MAG: hypothetical protein M1540_09300 [Candidatus Bathyarchaeota archaeon]|nr:hypothetical protein [Candidatus Bathyarchaeota archaeon]